jgi:hypothetical protein
MRRPGQAGALRTQRRSHESRLFEVLCPIDATVGFGFDQKTGAPTLVNAAGEKSAIRGKHLGQMIALTQRSEWRHPQRPILQMITPYHFLADEQVYMTQLPPFGHYRDPPLPGVMIGGRMPIDVWPRQLMWAFEWHDTKQNLVLRRGEPLYYVRFETADPATAVRMVETEMTPDLNAYLKGLTGVANYVNRTFSLFATARRRRPGKLLCPRHNPDHDERN